MITETVRISGGYYRDMLSGKRHQHKKTVTFNYRDEAERDRKLKKDKEAAEKKFREEVSGTKIVTTFAELVSLREKKISVKARTKFSDRDCVNSLLNSFGRMKITDINSALLEEYFEELAANGYTQAYQHRRYKFLKKYFRFAVQQELLTVNPILKLSYASYAKEIVKLPDPETVPKVKKLFSEAFKEADNENRSSMNWIKFRLQLLLIADGCLRAAELFGLTWSEINFDSRYMMVKNTACKLTKSEAERQGIPIGTIDTTKTLGSARKILLSQATLDYLTLWKAKTDEILFKNKAKNRNGYVFFSNKNIESKAVELVDSSGFTSRLDRFCKKHDIKHITPHEIRKACYSIRLNADLPWQYCEYVLGHSPGKANFVYITDMEDSSRRNHKKWEEILISMTKASVRQ